MPPLDAIDREWRRLTSPAVTASLLLVLPACGGGGGGPAPSTPPFPPGGDAGLEGTPATSIAVGTHYDFTPSVIDGSPDDARFSAANLPYWAHFDPNEGAITGRPRASDIGIYEGITITLTSSAGSATLGPFAVEVVPFGQGAAQLSWIAPDGRTDGSPLMGLAGFKVYWSLNPDRFGNAALIENPSLNVYLVESLTPGTWYLTATAVDASGAESTFGQLASVQIP